MVALVWTSGACARRVSPSIATTCLSPHGRRVCVVQGARAVPGLRHVGRAMREMKPGRFWCAATSPERDTEAGSEEVTETEAIAEATGTTGTTEAGGEQSPERLSTEEIARQMAALRQEKAEKEAGKGEEEGLVGGVMEEVGLIQWPSFGSSLVNTVLVIVIVFGTSAMLFGINTALTELSGVIYSK